MNSRRTHHLIAAILCLASVASGSAARAAGSGVAAKLAIPPLKIKSATIQLSGQETKNVASAITSLLDKRAEAVVKEREAFLTVSFLGDQALPSSASVAELAQAGREAGADLVLDGTVTEFAGTITYGFRPGLKERLAIEIVLYETATGRRVWHGREVMEVARPAPVNNWSNDRLEKKYLAVAAEEAFPKAFSALLGKISVELADYKPPVTGRTSTVAAADFIADVDRVPRSAKQIRKDAFAVVIGIEQYRDLPAADFTTRDARTMREYLIRVLGFPEENVIQLLNERATRSDIEGYVGSWLKKSAGRTATVVVYYAGHGAPNPVTGEPFLIPYDGNPAFLEASAIPLKRLYQMLAQLEVRDILLIMDSCFSGGGGRSVMAKGGRPIAISVENPMLSAKNIIVLSASRGSEISSSYPEKRHGLFTYYLLKGLQGEADLTGSKTITIEQLYHYLTPQVKRMARESMREQTPTITPSLDMLGARAREPLARLK